MKLTRRQEEFIYKLLDLYQEGEQPLHYTQLAERLGVSRFTAYDMLRLLEEKGLATSQYRLAPDRVGPGRSEVFFVPTQRAHQLVATLRGDHQPEQDWESAKFAVLRSIRNGAFPDSELAQEILGRIPDEDQGSSLQYCVEVMAVIALRLRSGGGRQLLHEYLPLILPDLDTGDMEDLRLLGGFALGVLASENADDPTWCLELFEHVKRYQTLISSLPARQRRALTNSLNDIYASFQENESTELDD
jgi:DNA-binding MarR family transcriptional regulator